MTMNTTVLINVLKPQCYCGRIANVCADANDGLSGVEIEFSMDDGESSIHDTQNINDRETTPAPVPDTAATAGSRVPIQGKRLLMVGYGIIRLTSIASLKKPDIAASWACWTS